MMRLGDIRYVNTVKTDIKVNLLMSNVNVLNLSRFKMKLTGKNIKSFTDLIQKVSNTSRPNIEITQSQFDKVCAIPQRLFQEPENIFNPHLETFLENLITQFQIISVTWEKYLTAASLMFHCEE